MEPFVTTNAWLISSEDQLNSQYDLLKLQKGMYGLLAPYFEVSQGANKKLEMECTNENDRWIKQTFTEQLISKCQEKFKCYKPTQKDTINKRKRKLKEKNESQLITWLNMITMLNSTKFNNPSITNENNTEDNIFNIEDISDELQSNLQLVFTKDTKEFDLENFYKRILLNNSTRERVISLCKQQYIIPKCSSFLMSDFADMKPLCDYAKTIGGFNLIVIDPPWENKSVERKNAYETFYMKRLFQLPIREIVVQDKNEISFIVMWVTNKRKYENFIKTELFPKWNINYLCNWFWLKITINAELICPIESNHKKPYEPMLIGIYDPSNSVTVADHLFSQKQLIISTPSFQHSRKPCLDELFDQIFTELNIISPRKLELFARNLTPGWCSWGNEVLFHQHASNFEFKEL